MMTVQNQETRTSIKRVKAEEMVRGFPVKMCIASEEYWSAYCSGV